METDIPETLGDAFAELRRCLTEGGIDQAGREARLLLRHAGMDEADLIARPDLPLNRGQWHDLAATAARRNAGEPLSRIRGHREFMGRAFLVTPDVLDPRPDTETLVEAALCHGPVSRLLDLGTGSGCVAISLLCAWPAAAGVAVDLSSQALAVAKANAERLGVDGRLGLHESSWYDSLPTGTFDLILANPPYIPSSEIAALDREVRLHDPIAALDGGADGLDAYRNIFAGATDRLTPGGAIMVEVGAGQASGVGEIAAQSGFQGVETYLDLAGIARVVSARRG